MSAPGRGSAGARRRGGPLRARALLGGALLVGLPLRAAPAGAPDPGRSWDEAALLRAALEGPVLGPALRAGDAAAAAAGAPLWRTPNPRAELRHEQANGPAGASTDAVGAAIAVPLGLPDLAERAAAGLRGDAGRADRRAAALSAACGLREGALRVWAAQGRAAAVAGAQDRLGAVAEALRLRAEAGELPAFDAARARLAVDAHRGALDAARADARAAAAALGALVGAPVAEVRLLPVPPLPEAEAALAAALAADPGLRADRAALAAAAAGRAVAARAALPTLELAGGARWDALPDGGARHPGYELGASLGLPLRQRGQAERAAAAADEARAAAELARHEAELRARVGAAWAEAAARAAAGARPPADGGLWAAALQRQAAGALGIEPLLGLAVDLEAAELAALAAEEALRRAHLELACAAGAFPEPALQPLLDEVLR